MARDTAITPAMSHDAGNRPPVVQATDITTTIGTRTLYRELSFSCDGGSSLAIVGPSGSGKTTLLNCLAGLDVPTAGTVRVAGIDVSAIGTKERTRYRLEHVGMVFQSGELLPELTVIQNVALPCQLRGDKHKQALANARSRLAMVNLDHRSEDNPSNLSGGEMQRVAIARALTGTPSLIIADEPTGALDEHNAVMIATLLKDTARAMGAALVVATHDPLVYERMDAVIDLRAYAP